MKTFNLSTFSLPTEDFEKPSYQCHVLLFQDVDNSSDKILKGLIGLPFPVTSVRSDMILDEFHLKSALVKALRNFELKVMKTRSLESEFVYALNPTTKINEGFKNFGLSSTTKNIMVLKINPPGSENTSIEELESKLIELIGKSPTPEFEFYTALEASTNLENIKKVYRIEHLKDDDKKSISDNIVTTMALKWYN